MGEIVFVGLGLYDEKGISLRGLDEVKSADTVFIELYTSVLPDFSMSRFENISGCKPTLVSRKELEDHNGKLILDAARNGKSVLLVPGDPLIATTHIGLRIEAKKQGIDTRIVHGASILSAVAGLSGLHSYKFGKSVTIPFPDETRSETPYNVLAQNKRLGLHTLCLLDIKAELKRCLSVRDGLNALLEIAKKRQDMVVANETLVVGIANAGSSNPIVKAGYLNHLLNFDFGEPPHSLVFPGKLHFMEAEALVILADAPEKIRKVAE